MASETPKETAPEAASPPPSSSSSSNFQPTWQLPPGIENHIEAFVLKTAIAIPVGAAAGMLLFRSGRGAGVIAGAAFGLGCAAGSFVERGVLGEGIDPALPKFELPDFLSGIGSKKD